MSAKAHHFRLVLNVVLFTVCAGAAAAQSLSVSAVNGIVTDPNNAAVPNATVTIENAVTGYKRSVNTGTDGAFRFISVPLNRYDLYASAAGFAITRAAFSAKAEGLNLRTTLMPRSVQQTGTTTLSGTVSLGDSGSLVHGATVTILQLRKVAYTDENGKYEFQGIPAGHYEVAAHLSGVPDAVQSVDVTSGNANTLNIQLHISGMKEQVTITATGEQQAVSSSIQSVDVIGSTDLAKKNPASLGAALENEAGVAKRSFGPGTERPVIRGFDGDRVLVLQDGNRIGALGFESGDHAEPIDLLTVERVEVVKGPATLLYGSSAIGGVVNVIEGHDAVHKGATGYLSGIASSNSNQAGGSGGIEYGTGPWLFWANGGGQRNGNYKTKLGEVPNSFSRTYGLGTGLGYYADKGFFSFNYQRSRLKYGIPFDPAETDPEAVFLNPHRDSFKFSGGFRQGGSFLEAGTFTVQYNRYTHSETTADTGVVNTSFNNKTLVYNGMFDQKRKGRLSGRFGFWGLHRDFSSAGEEALAPPTTQNAIAGFALETIDFERASLQFGGRIENNRYDPTATAEKGILPKRSFTGFSGAVGLRVPTWTGGAFVANYSHSYRAPALEELYNNGPHGGNVTFEIGDSALNRELSNGLDFGIRHSSKRVRVEASGFYYHIDNFVYLAPTGEVDEDSGLNIADYKQGTARFFGTEARFDAQLHPKVWLNLGTDFVNAELTSTHTPLPRIPPLRGRVGLELHLVKSLILNPEVVMANHQDRIFPIETPTAGYTVFNLAGSYLIARPHAAHIITFNAFNLGDRVYRNHLSFIKDFAPEMGRGVRATYTVRFF
jgi:iron complex outermembrane receptor protein